VDDERTNHYRSMIAAACDAAAHCKWRHYRLVASRRDRHGTGCDPHSALHHGVSSTMKYGCTHNGELGPGWER
jgi:hypothetical protein